MLNFIWSFMILAGILYGALTGNLTSMTENILDSAGEAVSLCLSMVGIVGFWMGLMEIATQSGLVQSMCHGISPLLDLLFPKSLSSLSDCALIASIERRSGVLKSSASPV